MTVPEPLATAWCCPRCDAERAADDAFCGRCGARRPTAEPDDPGPTGAATTGAASTADTGRAGRPVLRTLVLGGIVLGAVAAAVLVGRGREPAPVSFVPTAWRCDGSERAWVAALPAGAPDLRLEWRSDGPEGAVGASSDTTLAALASFARADGTYRVTTSGVSSPECGLAPGRWTLVIRDAVSDAPLAAGTVELRPPPP